MDNCDVNRIEEEKIFMINAKKKEVSLSWLVVSTRDYKAEYDWFLDKRNFGPIQDSRGTILGI